MEPRNSYQFPFSRYPAVRLSLLFITGILLFKIYQPALIWMAAIFMGLIIAFGWIEFRSKKTISTFLTNLNSLIFLLIVVLFGALLSGIHSIQKEKEIIQLVEVSDWEEVAITGQIQSISKTSSGKVRWDLMVSKTDFGAVSSTQKYKARILADEAEAPATLGDSVHFTGTIIPIQEKRNPHDFDYKAYLQSQDIQAQIRLEKMHHLQPNTKILEWVWWREKALILVDQNFDSQTAPIAKALLVGFKQDLDTESKTAFARAGLSHIMAVSGLHVGFIVAPFWVIIPWFWTKRYGSEIGFVLLLAILFCYAGLTGFSPSVMRASVMAGFLSYGKLFHKINDSVNLTAAAAFVLLVINPSNLFNIGFQLSFSAVFIILLILPVIQNLLPYWIRIRWYGKPLMIVIVSLVVQFGLYPLQVYYFGEVSLVSPIANALFVPLLGVVVPLSLVALFLAAINPALGFVINYPSYLFLDLMKEFVYTAASWNWAWTTASLGTNLIFLLWLFLIFFISAFHIPKLRWRLLCGMLGTLVLVFSIDVYQKFQPAKLTIIHFDVGQGDAALLQTPSGKSMLIDAGVWSPGYNSGKSIILPHLKSVGINKLDAVILSHPHADHIGGIIDLINEIPIKTIYNSGYPYDSNLYQNYLDLARQKSIPVKSVAAGDTLAIDPSILFLVLGPNAENHSSDPNEHSVVLNVIYGESEFLFTGDAGEKQEDQLVHTYGNLLDTDFLKVGHHGSRTSSSIPFLNQVTPEVAVVSLAERNKFRHPHPEAVNRLGLTEAELLFTSREKAIILESDGEHIRRIEW